MDGQTRREKILTLLQEATQPISGIELAGEFDVSRQVIVQDIALLRAVNKNILSTNKGYLLFQQESQKDEIRKTLKMKHNKEQIMDELYTIVDFGGKVSDVVVEHPIYGQITADLIITSRNDVDHFVEKVKYNDIKPLNELTDGVHFHTITVSSVEVLENIEMKLLAKGYLI